MNKETMKEKVEEKEMDTVIIKKVGVTEETTTTGTVIIIRTEIRAIATTTGMIIKIIKKEYKLSKLSKKKKFNGKLSPKGGSAGHKP